MPRTIRGRQSTATVTETLARPLRTGQQGGVLFALIELLTAFGLLELDGRQYAAVMLVGTPVVGYLQVLFENHVGKAFLRKLPTRPQQVPVIGDDSQKGGADLATILIAAAVCIVILFVLWLLGASPPAR